MKYVIAAMFSLAMVSALSAQQTYTLTAPDKSFHVTFPGQPKLQEYQSDSGTIHIDGHSYSSETSASKFVLNYINVTPPPPPELKASVALDSAVSGTLENVGGKLLTQESLVLRGQDARAVTISVGDKTIIDGRLIYAKPRVYQLLVLHKKRVTPAFQQQFFDSFALLK